MIDRTIPNGAIGRCPACGGEELFEDGRFVCFGYCRDTSGSVHGEVTGPDPAS
jgi:uncharacterized protein (DUF983 family)